MPQSFTAAQLYGTGSVVTVSMTSATTFQYNATNTQAPNHVYITFDVIGGSSTEYPLENSDFTQTDVSGVNLHVAYSTTNWAYSFPQGQHDTGYTVIAPSLPGLLANTMRVRGLGLDRDVAGTVLTIDDEGVGLEVPYAIPNVV